MKHSINERERIAAALRGDQFAQLYAATAKVPHDKRRDSLPRKQDKLRVPMAVMADDLRDDMQTQQTVVHLSGYTIGKQKVEHRDVAAADYLLVQRIVDGAHIHRQSETHRIGFAQDDDGKWWTAAWKTTEDDCEVLAVNLRRAKAAQLTAAAKYGAPLRRKK